MYVYMYVYIYIYIYIHVYTYMYVFKPPYWHAPIRALLVGVSYRSPCREHLLRRRKTLLDNLVDLPPDKNSCRHSESPDENTVLIS